MEFLHNFMLIHDDIIDNSDLRRGKPTMHKMLENIVPSKRPVSLGKELAIIAGDILYALAIDAFLSVKALPDRKERALKYFIQTAALTAMGEFIDTIHGLEPLTAVGEKDVMLNYSLKTARYTFDCPLVVGAILGGANKKETQKLAELGLMIGQAFQIQDDVIGIFDTEENIGKSVLSDLQESKKTLLVCHAFNKLKGNDKEAFVKIFNKRKKTYGDLEKIRKIFIDSGSLEYCLSEIRERMKKSSKIMKNLSMRNDIKQIINTALMQFFNNVDQIAVKYGFTQIL
jgi:geranylgeranyl diphosphate synthase type I